MFEEAVNIKRLDFSFSEYIPVTKVFVWTYPIHANLIEHMESITPHHTHQVAPVSFEMFDNLRFPDFYFHFVVFHAVLYKIDNWIYVAKGKVLIVVKPVIYSQFGKI